MTAYDAVIVGSGPNGLAAGIELARAGLSVLVREAAADVGGGVRSMELTLPGFVHDPFSAVHPLAVGSPFLTRLPLAAHGLEWIHSPAPLAHPFDDGSAAMLERSLEATAATLGPEGKRYVRLMRPLARKWHALAREILAPPHLPRAPVLLARFGTRALLSAERLARLSMGTGRGAALFAGSGAHSGLSLNAPASAAFGLVLNAAGHAVGWPIPKGGAGRLSASMAGYLRELGGTIETGIRVNSLRELPPARVTLLDLTPRELLRVAAADLPPRYVRRLRRYRYGVGVFKLDWALAGPIPWTARVCGRAATVHLGGSLAQVVESTRITAGGGHAARPFTLLAQPSLFDPTRGPPDKHTAWAYCHVPNGSTRDMTAAVEAQVERFAPGFRDLIIGRSALSTSDLEAINPNLVGGDLNGGAPILAQLFLRPVMRLDPYRTPRDGLYICSAATPPGGGVHGMCGFHAARSALRALGIPPRDASAAA